MVKHIELKPINSFFLKKLFIDHFFYTILNKSELNTLPSINEKYKNKFIKFLNRNFIFELYYQFTKDSVFKEEHKTEFQYLVIKNQYLSDKVKTLLRKYDDRVTLLKGISLLNSIYKDTLSRHLSDIDILIDDYVKFKKFLVSNGYKQVHYYPETFRKENIKIDIHTDLINKTRDIFQSRIVNLDNKQVIYDNIIKVENNIYRLNNELEYIYLLSHLFIHHDLTGLKWLADIFLYNKSIDFRKYYLTNLLNLTRTGELYIFFNILFEKYLYKKIETKSLKLEKVLYKIIGWNRYSLHLYFLHGFCQKIRYIIYIIKYILKY